jgi:hydroxypyruvate isomerase
LLKLSAHIGYLFTERPLVDRFLAARDAGFVSVDLSDVVRYPLAEILEGMRRSGLSFRQTTAAAFNADGRGPGLAALPGREVEFRACCAAVLNYFEATGLRGVHLPSGTPAPTIPLVRSYATYLDNLRHALELFEPYRVGVLIEPINRVDIPGYFLDLPLARRVVAEVAIPIYVSCLTSIMSQWKVSIPHQRSVRAAPDIGHIRIADAPGRHEPGTGNINFAAVLNALAEIGYDNCIAAEYLPAGRTEDGLGWMKALLALR